jgi:hypothetical protein
MKPTAIILGVSGGIKEEMVGANLTKIQHKHIQKCHNESPLYN